MLVQPEVGFLHLEYLLVQQYLREKTLVFIRILTPV